MKDKPARALAIIALVFMGIFVASLIATLADATLLHGGIGIIALCSGVFVLMIFVALKADGRGFSLTKMKNESEMKKIEQALKEQEESENAQKSQNEKIARSHDNAEDGTGEGDEAAEDKSDGSNAD